MQNIIGNIYCMMRTSNFKHVCSVVSIEYASDNIFYAVRSVDFVICGICYTNFVFWCIQLKSFPIDFCREF